MARSTLLRRSIIFSVVAIGWFIPLGVQAQNQPKCMGFMIFYDWGLRLNLSAQANGTLDQAAALVRQRLREGTVRSVVVTAHTDTLKVEGGSIRFTKARAEDIIQELVRRGVPRPLMSGDGKGSENLLVKTADNVREPQNRRTEILIC